MRFVRLNTTIAGKRDSACAGVLTWIDHKLAEPPPDYFFEISGEALRWVAPGQSAQVESFPERSVIPSPGKQNVVNAEPVRKAVANVAANVVEDRNRVALAIPDYAARITILEFGEFPADEEDRQSLIRFRLRKTVPFDVNSARVSYQVQSRAEGRIEVLAVIVANPILEEYETLLSDAGFRVGLVLPSTLATLRLLKTNTNGLNAIAALEANNLSLFLVEGESVRLSRCVALSAEEDEVPCLDLEAVLSLLQQTAAYAEDQMHSSVAKLLIFGFGEESQSVKIAAETVLNIPCEDFDTEVGIDEGDHLVVSGLLKVAGTLGSPGINIASRPFQRERKRRAAVLAGCAGLACSLLLMLCFIGHALIQTAHMREALAAQSSELERLQLEQGRYLALLSQPQSEDVFAWSVLLNELLAHRGLSWAKIFQDLSTVLPPNMRLIGIRVPQVMTGDPHQANRLQLDMVVATEQPASLLNLLNALQTSELFGSATVMSQTSPTQDDPNSKFRVLVGYAQRL